MSTFKIVAGEKKNQTIAQVSEHIGKTCELFEVRVPENSEFVVEFRDLSYISSAGTRSWILWSREIPPSSKLVLRRCPRAIIHQLNVVEGFLTPNTFVESFLVPYYCDNCTFETNELAVEGKDFKMGTKSVSGKVDIHSTMPCPKCKSTMEMDTLWAKYFTFLNP
jgi:hypothetical protein